MTQVEANPFNNFFYNNLCKEDAKVEIDGSATVSPPVVVEETGVNGALIGGIIGGVILLIVIGALIYCFACGKKTESDDTDDKLKDFDPVPGDPTPKKNDTGSKKTDEQRRREL